MIACIRILNFALRLNLLERPELDGEPLVLSPAHGERQKVLDCTPEARALYVRPGMAIRDVPSMCPTAVILKVDPAREAAESQRIMAKLEAISPFIEADPQEAGCWYVDLHGLDRLLGPLPVIAQTLLHLVPPALRPRVGIADGKFTARVAAGRSPAGSFTLVNPAETKTFLAIEAIESLPKPPEMLLLLKQLGIETLGHLAELPPSAVAARLGPSGRDAWELANGRGSARVEAAHTEEVLRERMELPAPTASREILLYALGLLAEQITQQPQMRDYGARQVLVRARFEQSGSWEKQIAMREPVRGARLAELLRLRFRSLELPQPVAELELELSNFSQVSGRQELLQGFRARDNRPIVEADQQLKGRYRKSSLFRVVPVEPWSRFPERRYALMPHEPVATDEPQPLNMPSVIQVEARSSPLMEREPVRLTLDGQERIVERVDDFWFIEDEWWLKPINRHYFEVLLDNDVRTVIYYDLVEKAWYSQPYDGLRPVPGNEPRSRAAAPDYVELHLHTNYSFLDGASHPEEFVLRAKELGYHALAITDHDGLHGALEFAKAAKHEKIQPITGAELTLVDGSHITLLAETQEGYRNLCQLITAAHHTQRLNADPWLPEDETSDWDDEQAETTAASHHYRLPKVGPWLEPALLKTYARGLILLTGCRKGRLARLVDADRLKDAAALLQQYIEWFGANNVFVELQQNRIFGDTRRIELLVRLARAAGVGYVATGNAHYHRRGRRKLQDVLVAIRHRTTLDGCHRQRLPNSEFHLASAEEMRERFRRYPEAIQATVEIARRCATFNLNNDLGYTFPDYHDVQQGETPDDTLRRICAAPFEKRYPPDSKYRVKAEERLAAELALIKQQKLAGFFLIHHDLLELAREVAIEVRGIDTYRAKAMLPPGRGRGSSVSSIVCYLIGLSPVDPLKYKLSVRRFLNEYSEDPPDIDLDFPRDIREKLLERIHADYGDHAAMICAFATYRLRSAVRDIGKALGLPAADLDRIAKLSEPHSAQALSREMDRIPTFAKRKHLPPWSHLIELAAQLAKFPRHVTQHSGGVVVSSNPLTQMVPVQPAAMDGRFLCQWDKDSCSDAGFVKIDFLALGMLSLVEETMILIGESGEEVPELSTINLEDQKIFEMIQRGDTVGTFQVESRAQIQTMLRTQPMTLNDLVVQVAIVRPGPIIGGAVTPYIQRRKNPNFVPTYAHPLLKPVLEDTLGVILFQEQVVEVAVALANFTPGQADELRKAMTRKRSLEAINRHHDAFVAGAMANGATEEVAEKVFENLAGFSSYGFPQGHAASFAVLAYQSCYLKLYYPTEFLCALLNNQPMGFYPPHMLVNDAKRQGVHVKNPDINASSLKCSVIDPKDKRIRVGLAFIKGLGEDEATAIIAERAARGPFLSLADFMRRVSLRQATLENMISVGTFDGFGLGRRELLWQAGLFVPSRQFGQERVTKTRARKPNRLAGIQQPLPLPIDQDLVALPPTSVWQRMANDYRIIGMSPLYHPLGLLRSKLPTTLATTQTIETMNHGDLVRIGGLVVCRQRPGTAKGVTFLLIEDEFGTANIVVYARLYEAQRNIVRGEPFILVDGVVQREDRNLNIIARNCEPLRGVVRSRRDVAHILFDGSVQIAETELPSDLEPASHNYR